MRVAKDFLKGVTWGFLYFGIVRFIITIIHLLLKREYSFLVSIIIEGLNITGYFLVLKMQYLDYKKLLILGLIILLNSIALVITVNTLLNPSDYLLKYPNLANFIYLTYGIIIFFIALWKRKSPLL